MQIKDRVAVVTGAASGIGKATAQELVARGIHAAAIVDINSDINDVASEINNGAEREIVIPFIGDVTDDSFRKKVFDHMCECYGSVHILVPAAGILRDRLAVQLDKNSGSSDIYPIETFREVLEVNLIHPVYWAIELISRIAETRRVNGLGKWSAAESVQGTVIFTGSVSSLGNKGQVSYATTKAGLEGAASTLMKEAIFHGVRTGVIHPGFVDTPLLKAMPEGFVEKHILPGTQLGRLIQPEEIADAICFMISNCVVSGELWADAGWHPAAA